jgi:hypothetical protein
VGGAAALNGFAQAVGSSVYLGRAEEFYFHIHDERRNEMLDSASSRNVIVFVGVFCFLVGSMGCTNHENPTSITKDDVKKSSKADWSEDYCLTQSWYWDGICDTFCLSNDPDCTVIECIESCGMGCPAPEYWVCGDDGQLYCNECYMACFGVQPAKDPATCDSGPDPQDCLEECGMGCPAPEHWVCGNDGQLYCTECHMACFGVQPAKDPATCDSGPDPQVCLEECGMGCPAPEYWVCGNDGQLYCNECYMACFGVQPAEDPTTCDSGPDPQDCLEECGIGCPAPEYWVCGNDGQLYCNECYMTCFGVQPAEDPTTCDSGPDPQDCLEECGIGCPAPEYWVCGNDGQLYCNECYMTCFGAQLAEDPATCKDAVRYCIYDTDCAQEQTCVETRGICE